MNKSNKILITGATGLSGSAIHKELKAQGYKDIVTPTHKEIDLSANRGCISDFFKQEKIEYVFHCAGIIGGHASHYRVTASEMLTEDIKINLNTAEASAKNGVKKLIAIGGQWNYKSRTDRAIMESDYDHSFAGGSSGHDVSKYVLHSLLGYMKTEGKLNSTVLMIPLLYNETLTEDLNERHPLLHIVNNIAHAAKKKLQTIHLGSTQTNKRQLIHSSDLAKAAIMAMSIDTPLLNVANQEVFSMQEIVDKLRKKFGYSGKVTWENASKNVGPQALDCSLIKSKGWKANYSLDDVIDLICF
jgi:GDP-L-fucose synthase